MAEKYSNTGTTTTSRNEVATLLRITKKAKENVNKTVSNRTSEKTGISKTDVKDQRLQTTPEVEDKSNKNQQDVAHLLSNQRVQKKHVVEDKTNKNQQDVPHLQSRHDPFNIKVFEKLFTGSLFGRLIGPKAYNVTIKYTHGDCARACADLPTTKCMSFNYYFGGSVCELMEAIEGHHYSRAKSGLYEHYERLGIGKSTQFVYDSLQLHHNKLYYFNLRMVNVLGYESIINTQGVIVDTTIPETANNINADTINMGGDGTNITVKNTDKKEQTNTSVGSSSSSSSENETPENFDKMEKGRHNSDCGQEPGDVDIIKEKMSKMKPVSVTEQAEKISALFEELAETNKKQIESEQEKSKKLGEMNKKLIELKQEIKELAETKKKLIELEQEQSNPVHKNIRDLAWVVRYTPERSNKTSGPFYNDVYGKDYDDSGRSSVKDGTNSAVTGVSGQNIGISILLMDTGDKEIQDIEMKLQDQKTRAQQLDRIDKILSQALSETDQDTVGFTPSFPEKDCIELVLFAMDTKIKDIEMKLQVKQSNYKNMYLAEERFEEILGKEFHVQIDEYKKCLFSAMLLIDNDEKTHQHLGKKEKLIKKVKQLQSQLLKENQLIELENTELVFPLLKEQHVLKEREGDFQKEDELKEQVKIELLAENILFPRTKIRNAKSKMNFSSVYRACYLYRKNILARMLVSLEQLIEALDSIKSPHYIWPSGHPLILSKERQIELDFFPNEYMERLLSFLYGRNRWHRTWNSDQIVRPEPMVLAGFSYDGEDDKVVCKSCGAISDVNDWSDDDEDYAFTMHRRTGSSHCEFLRKFDPRRSKM